MVKSGKVLSSVLIRVVVVIVVLIVVLIPLNDSLCLCINDHSLQDVW